MTTGDYNLIMKVAGVRQLKARLSEYLRSVRAGETILITDRDEVIAELRPARHRAHPGNNLEEVLEALAETGEITRSSLPKRGWTWKVRGLGLPAGTAQAILDEIRADRLSD